MKIIFLDFDGVILTTRTCIAGGRGYTRSGPDQVTMRALHRIGCTGRVQLVISSTHRDSGETHCHKILDAFAFDHPLTQFLHPDWRTDGEHDNNGMQARPGQIERWLAAHPDVTDYRILDDDLWMWTEHQKPRWAQCDPHNGLQWLEMDELMKWAEVPKPAALAAAA